MILQLSHWGWAILIAVTELLQVSASCWSWLGSFLSVGPQFGPLGWFFFVLWCFLSSLDPNRTKQGFLRLRLRTGTKLNNHYILLVIAGHEARLEWWKKGTGALRLLGYMEGWRGVMSLQSMPVWSLQSQEASGAVLQNWALVRDQLTRGTFSRKSASTWWHIWTQEVTCCRKTFWSKKWFRDSCASFLLCKVRFLTTFNCVQRCCMHLKTLFYYLFKNWLKNKCHDLHGEHSNNT